MDSMNELKGMSFKRALIIHVLCWSIVLFFPLLFYGQNSTWAVTLRHWVRSLGSPLGYMVLFYVNYLWLIPKFYFRGRKEVFWLLNVAFVALALGIIMGWWHLVNDLWPMNDFKKPPRGPKPPRTPMYYYNVISLILVAALSLAVRMGQRWQHMERARKEAEQSRTEAELSNLRNQVNPHFLLNTLNNIYALISFDKEKAQWAVAELSKLLRHVLYENRQEYVPLRKEADFMRNYIELMRIRLTDQVSVEADIAITDDDDTPIAPLIFISLLENAFKHGISPQGKGRIAILLKREGAKVVCEIVNSNFPKRANDKSGSGIGLEQVSKRLELMYPDHYVWERGVREDEYFSRIEINTQTS